MSKRRPSPWVPLSVYYFDDAALMDAGEFAELMFTRMMAYAGRHRDWNGRLPRTVVLCRLGIYALENVPESAPETRLERLLESGLVTAHGSHVQIEGWLKWNEPGDQVEIGRDRDRDRKAALTRGEPESAPETVPESAPDSSTDSGTGSGAQDKKRLEEKKTADADAIFEAFWAAYPRRSGDNPKKPARIKWDKLTKTTDPETIITAAKTYALIRQNEPPQFTPQAVTWLNQGRFEDVTETRVDDDIDNWMNR